MVKRLRYERSLPVQSQFIRDDVLKCCNVIDGLVEQLETQRAMANGWRLRLGALLAVCEDYLLWEPRKSGHAEQHNRFSEYVRGERVLLGDAPNPASGPQS